MFNRKTLIATVTGLLSLGTAPAVAQCVINFDDLAAGTAVTDQYPGVTFSVRPQSCKNNPSLYMRVTVPDHGTSSGTKCIKIDAGCPDFSDDYLRMVFDQYQTEVSFTLGDWTATYTVRYYSTTSGSTGLIGSFAVDVEPLGTGEAGVHRRVTVRSTDGDIRRIEVEGSTSSFEAIDDLTFYSDPTPPISDISAPDFEACDCDNLVSVRGRACDDDGDYDYDTLHYMPVGGDAWTLIGTAHQPACKDGSALYNWNTTDIADGCYFLKLTVYNACGLSSEDVTVVCIDRDFQNPAIRSPGKGAMLGGSICIDGTVYDRCFDHYAVDWKPVDGGNYSPVNPDLPEYTTTVITDPLASWDTLAAPNPADGKYRIRVEAVDLCGELNDSFVDIVLDNTAPEASISAPLSCRHVNGRVEIRGTANDANLAGWTLQYTGGTGDADHTWVNISSGSKPVINGVLGNWDTNGLATCAYVLRLVVTDKVNVNCSGLPHVSEYSTAVDVRGGVGDINCDGDVNFNDIDAFVECLINGECEPCP